MAQAKKKAIPAKRGTKKASPAPARARRVQPEPVPEQSQSKLVPMTTEWQERENYREIEVQALETGVYAYVERPAGEKFKAGVVGDGPLPSWVREV